MAGDASNICVNDTLMTASTWMAKSSQKYTLDITGEVCPMTFVRVKLQLARMAGGAELTVRLREGEPLINVPRSLRQEGHEVVSLAPLAGDVHQLVVRKKPD